MEAHRKKVLIIDDDPSHLEIYGLLVKRAGYDAVPLLVRFAGLEAIPEVDVALVLLDYRLNSVTTAPELAQAMRQKFPSAPIVVLSDLWTLPRDIAPFADEFVRKGEPEKLLKTIRRFLSTDDSTPDA